MPVLQTTASPSALSLSDKSQRGNREPKKPKRPAPPAPLRDGRRPGSS